MANASIVARGAIGIRKEESFASGGGIDNWQVVETANIMKTDAHVFQDRIRNTPEQVAGRYQSSAVTGSIVFPVSPANPRQWWVCGIGGSGPYSPQLPLPSMVIEIQEGDIAAVNTSGDMIEKIEFASKYGDTLKCTVQIEGKDMNAKATPSTVSFISGDDGYLHTESVFTLDGVVYNNIIAFSVAKNNNLVKDLYANNTTRRNILATKAVVTGSLQILFEDISLRDRFLNHLPSAISAVYTRGANSFTISIPKAAFDSRDANLQGQTHYIVGTFTFQAYVDDPTAENSLKVTVV